MPLHFQCPHCGMQTNVDDRYSGQTGPCAGCGQTVTIPPIAGAPDAASGGARPSSSGSGAMVGVFLVVIVAGLLLCGGAGLVVFRSYQGVMTAANTAAMQSQCRNNLKQLGLAMHNYHDVHGTFPPAYVTDEDGQPMHSWRVLLLPFMEEQYPHDAYNFDEPWDSPANLDVASTTPFCFQCPEDYLSASGQTSYLMVVAPGMLSDGPTANTLADVKDGTSSTIMFVESHNSGIGWSEPRDLDGTAMSFMLNSQNPGELNGHPDSVQVVLCDGSVRSLLPFVTTPEEVEAMLTIAGGEAVSPP